MLAIDEIEGRIAVTGKTWPIREVLKALPGRTWDPDHTAWTFPRTASTYRMLTTLFKDAVIRSTLVDLEKKVGILDKAMEAKDLPHKLPMEPCMKTDPWLHQQRSFYFAKNRLLAQGGAMLALDMGCGKSKVAIDLINSFDCKRVLITCPTSVMDVWPEQFMIHSARHHRIYLCNRKHSVKRRWQEAEDFIHDNDECGVVVINHEALWRKPFSEQTLLTDWDMLIVDESHRAKSAGGKFSRYLQRLGKVVDLRLGLTGTPCPHSIDDMYAQGRFLDPSVWGTNHQVYKAQYLVTMPGHDGTYSKVIGYKNVDDWNEKFHGLAVQVKSEDTLDLPETMEVNRYTELDEFEREVYNDMKHQFVAQVKDGTITAANALVKLLRLAQIVQGSSIDHMDRQVEIGTSKKKLLKDVLEDITEPVVVFCRFKCDLRNILDVGITLGRNVYELSGRTKELQDWKDDCAKDRPSIIAVQIQAGGVGISMVQARYCIYMSKDFNLGGYEQSRARVHRPGQKEKVTYIHLVAKDTIDETINSALSKRKVTVEEILADIYDEEPCGKEDQ